MSLPYGQLRTAIRLNLIVRPQRQHMKRPRSIILLILWFFWAAGKDRDALARYSTTSDYYILSSSGLTLLFFAMAGAVFLLNAAGAYYLVKPAPIGFRVLLVALAAGAVQN